MIENYRSKKEKNNVVLEDKGDYITAKVKRFDPETGEPEMFDMGQTNSNHIEDLIKGLNSAIEDAKQHLKSLESKMEDLETLQIDVVDLEIARKADKKVRTEAKSNVKPVEK